MSTPHIIRTVLKGIIPEATRSKYHNFVATSKRKRSVSKARIAFERADKTPSWLDGDTLDELQAIYPLPPFRRYDPEALKSRGDQRASELATMIPDAGTFLELGCGDGMVSAALQRNGKATHAIDLDGAMFDERAVAQGVSFAEMDALHLKFKDQQFDAVFTYDGFEHFAEPEQVLREVIRVTKTGGYFYINCAPLYFSPRGLHAYRRISVPYCQHLFSPDVLADFALKKDGKPLEPPYTNKWPVEAFRELWDKYTSSLACIKYKEFEDYSSVALIEKYPSCFRGKTDYFDNLVVAKIEALFKRV